MKTRKEEPKLIIHQLKEALKTDEDLMFQIEQYSREILLINSLELNKVEGKLKKLYSNDGRGRKAISPVKMLTSLVLKTLLKEASTTKWVRTTRANKVIALVCGFDKCPGVGTYYDFLSRLEDGDYKKCCEHNVRVSDINKGYRHLRTSSKKEDKDKDYQGVTAKLVKELLEKVEQLNPDDLQNRLQSMFNEIALQPSIEKGLIDKDNLHISGDGSALVSGCAENGRPSCDCRSKKIYRCDCPKYFSDSNAKWGWDCYREVYFFGHKFYQLTSSASGHDLPLSITIESGNNTDFTMSVKTIDRFLKSCPDLKITSGSFDSGHDAMAIYNYLDKKNIMAAIVLNPKTKVELPDRKISEKGIPLCPAGIEMKFHHRSSKNKSQCYRCPAKHEVKKSGKSVFVPDVSKCPIGVLCQDDERIGPIVCISESDNPRIFPSIPRHSKKYTELMNLRSGCERSNSMKKEAYKIEQTDFKRDSRFLIKLYLIAMIEHSTAWVNDELKLKAISEKELLLQMLEN